MSSPLYHPFLPSCLLREHFMHWHWRGSSRAASPLLCPLTLQCPVLWGSPLPPFVISVYQGATCQHPCSLFTTIQTNVFHVLFLRLSQSRSTIFHHYRCSQYLLLQGCTCPGPLCKPLWRVASPTLLPPFLNLIQQCSPSLLIFFTNTCCWLYPCWVQVCHTVIVLTLGSGLLLCWWYAAYAMVDGHHMCTSFFSTRLGTRPIVIHFISYSFCVLFIHYLTSRALLRIVVGTHTCWGSVLPICLLVLSVLQFQSVLSYKWMASILVLMFHGHCLQLSSPLLWHGLLLNGTPLHVLSWSCLTSVDDLCCPI